MDLGVSDVILRLVTAVGAGGIIGLNRDLAGKPIGVRTLGLVALGAAVVSVAGIQVPGMAENSDAIDGRYRMAQRRTWGRLWAGSLEDDCRSCPTIATAAVGGGLAGATLEARRSAR